MSPGNWRSFCLGLNVSIQSYKFPFLSFLLGYLLSYGHFQSYLVTIILLLCLIQFKFHYYFNQSRAFISIQLFFFLVGFVSFSIISSLYSSLPFGAILVAFSHLKIFYAHALYSSLLAQAFWGLRISLLYILSLCLCRDWIRYAFVAP